MPTTPPSGSSWPRTFFVGKTEGQGVLTKIVSHQATVTVRGSGRIDSAGALILDQTVSKSRSATKMREWRLSEGTPGSFTGTLTDAAGAVTGLVRGNDFHVRYRMKGGIQVDQHLMLQPGGRTILNQMTFRKFGVAVAHMRETINHAG